MTENTCRACREHPVHETFVCQSCCDQLHGDLHSIPDLVRDLEIEITGQACKTAPGPQVAVGGGEQPLPVNMAASRALDHLRFNLVAACMSVSLGQRDRLPEDRIGAMVAWLLHYEAAIRLRDDGGEICRGIAHSVRRARAVCDSPPERRYIGRCVCSDSRGERTRLYARMGEAVYRCPGCATQWLVAERFAQLEDDLAGYGLTRSELETLLPEIPRATLARWLNGDSKQRPALGSQGTTVTGEPVYRYGDVLALDAKRRARRSA